MALSDFVLETRNVDGGLRIALRGEQAGRVGTHRSRLAGAAALLTYYVDAVTTAEPEVVFPELDANGRPFESTSIDVPRRDFAYFIIRNVAAALSNMAPAGEGD
jgi:hypothetical protein